MRRPGRSVVAIAVFLVGVLVVAGLGWLGYRSLSGSSPSGLPADAPRSVLPTTVTPDSPDGRVRSVVSDLRTWTGITYRGTWTGYAGQSDITFDVTVGRDGDMAGRLTKPGGADADFARIEGVELLRAGPSWFTDGFDAGRSAEKLAGVWAARPLDTAPGLGDELLSPAGLADRLDAPGVGAYPGFPIYTDRGPVTYAGRPAVLLGTMLDELVVTRDVPSTLLAHRRATTMSTPRVLQTTRATPQALARIGAARAQRGAPDTSALLERVAMVRAVWEPVPPTRCSDACRVTVRITNPERFPARGVVEVTVNGELRGGMPYEVPARGSALFTTLVASPPAGAVWGLDVRGDP